ncbi:MAG TPA: sporulation protein [Pseudonocardiaceae bacterium]|jgi:uncharacterized spore protein YtfJ|nr:sporulation protein [Pseudonocardiaceae bacterium]
MASVVAKKADMMVDRIADAVSARRVFAEPVERAGTTVIGVARVRGGGGGSQRIDGAGDGGFGLLAGPVGAYVIRDGRVRWLPAVDVNRIVVLLVMILVLVQLRKARRRRRQAVQGSDT